MYDTWILKSTAIISCFTYSIVRLENKISMIWLNPFGFFFVIALVYIFYY